MSAAESEYEVARHAARLAAKNRYAGVRGRTAYEAALATKAAAWLVVAPHYAAERAAYEESCAIRAELDARIEVLSLAASVRYRAYKARQAGTAPALSAADEAADEAADVAEHAAIAALRATL